MGNQELIIETKHKSNNGYGALGTAQELILIKILNHLINLLLLKTA